MNQVGDDEIVYTPVLYLDTLKVSIYEKTAESVFATGGLKNKNLIKWNFGKSVQLTLEDALFSPASMSMIWGGKLDSTFSDATSLVAKINYANVYGRLRYSTKAYPSPQLTNDEWNIVFKIIQNKLEGTTLDILDNDVANTLDDDLKTAFINRYYDRPVLFDGVNDVGSDTGKNDLSQPWTYTYDLENFGTYFGANYLSVSQLNLEGYENINDHYDDNGVLKVGHYRWYSAKAMPEYVIYIIRNSLKELSDIGNIKTNIGEVEVVDRMEKCLVTKRDGFKISTKEQLDNLFRYYADDRSETYSIYYDAKTMLPLLHIEDDEIQGYNLEKFWETSTLVSENRYDYGNYQELDVYSSYSKLYQYLLYLISTWDSSSLGDSSSKGYTVTFSLDNVYTYTLASASSGINISQNSILDYEVLYEILASIATNRVLTKEPDYYLPRSVSLLLNYSTENGWSAFVRAIGLRENDFSWMNDIFKIKFGTVYYKWTRTVKYQEYEDDAVLGSCFTIDADTFPDDYKIVGETYIRNQKTGKDQRYQITIFKANVSSDTSITLQADGDPTTFSMTIDVLVPENDIMMEMIQLDTEEDRFQGGTRILPQKTKLTYTPAMEDYGDIITPIDNNEIY